MTAKNISIHIWLYPLAWLYELVIRLRNQLFDWGILHSQSFPLPVICIGNLTVGGTGKTPHTEYLIRLLCSKQMQTGVLSRGYKRKSKGFQWAFPSTPMEQIGDEPFQMKSKYPFIRLAVDANRPHGISRMIDPEVYPPLDVILLDDAYQHRYVKAGMNILLTDYHRPIYADTMLPAGRLREPFSGAKRADIIIVSKCPDSISPEEAEIIRQHLNPSFAQEIFFSTLSYGTLYAFKRPSLTRSLESLKPETPVFILTGIATPDRLLNDIKSYTTNIYSICFPDHHSFTNTDAEKINREFRKKPKGTIIITTEKDATRLTHLSLSEDVWQNLYILPVEVKFLFGQEPMFNKKITHYVGTYSRNSSIS